MADDRHEVWRNVADVHARLEKNEPRPGESPVVEVYLSSREAPVTLGVVETSRDLEYPWVKLYTGDVEQGYVWVDESYITQIEITFRPSAKVDTGFRVDTKD